MGECKVGNNDEIKIDLRSMVFDILKNLVIIIMVSLLAALAAHLVIKSTHKPTYKSKLSYVVVSTDTSVINNKDTQNRIVKVFQEVLESSLLRSSIKESLGYQDGENFTAEISTEIVQNTNINGVDENGNIIIVTVSDSDPLEAYYAAKALMSNCGTASDYINKNAILTVLEKPAIPSADSNAVNYIKTDILVFAAAFVVLCAIAGFISVKRDSIRNAEEIKEKLGSKLLASIPDVSMKGRKKAKRNLLVTDKHTGFYYIENIKKIRSKIELLKPDEHGMCIAVSSVSTGEGRSTIAANLALSIAMHKNKVLLVDMDFKNPSLHKLLGYDGTIPSFSKFLEGEGTLTETTRSIENIKVLFQENAVNNSSKVIDSKNMKTFFSYVKEQYDYIIIDTSPISASADMEVLAEIIDYAVLVVKQDTAPSADINEAIDMLERNKCELIGCVFNGDTKSAKESSYGYGYYGRYSGYGNYSNYSHRDHK